MGLKPYDDENKESPKLDIVAQGLTFRETSHTRQLWTVVAVTFCFGFIMFTIGVHIVPHATDIGISAASAANILSLRAGSGLIGGIVLGALADRIGNRKAFAICFIFISVALIWLLTATEEWMLFLFAAILGLGAGGAATLPSPLNAELFGTRSLGVILGVTSFCFTIGTAVGPYLAGYIFDVKGSYQIAFTVCAAVAVTGLILVATLRPIKKREISI
jgi:MFS family permease